MMKRQALLLATTTVILLGPPPAAWARSPRNAPLDLFGGLFGGSSQRPRAKRNVVRLEAVPLPHPRPAEAPARPGAAAEKPAEAPKPVEAAAPPPPPQPASPSACRLALTETIAIAPSIPDISGPGSCGGQDLVRLEAILLPGGARVAVKPAATLRCEMATAVVAWMREDIAPLAAGMAATPVALDNFDSFECRGRNRAIGGKLSEHGHANALDVRGIALSNGVSMALTDRATPRETRERVLQSVCARFSTVLGPGSDGYHEDHIHIDLAARRGGYRICQWQVDDAMPAIAPLLPASRPAEAPPREAAEKPAPPSNPPAITTGARSSN